MTIGKYVNKVWVYLCKFVSRMYRFNYFNNIVLNYFDRRKKKVSRFKITFNKNRMNRC